MAIPNHYQQGFQTCNYRDSQEKVDTAGMQEITQSGVYVGTLSGGFLQDYQAKSDGTPGTLCQVTLVTDDNRAFSRFSFTFLKNGQYGKQGMAVLMLAQDPYGQKAELFPRITEGNKDGKEWFKLDDADGLRVTVVLFVNGTYQSSIDGSVHPKTECLGIFDGNGHSPNENRSGRADTAALNSAKHWLRTKMEEAAAQGGYGYQQAAPQQWQGQPSQGYQQVSMPQQGGQQQWQTKVSQPRQPSPTQSLDMAVAANERAMAQYRNQQAAQQQQQGYQQTAPQPQAQWAGFNAPPPQQAPMPDPGSFAVPGQQKGFQDDPLPF